MRLWPERKITIWLGPTAHKRLVEAAKAGKVPKFKSYVDRDGTIVARIPQSLWTQLIAIPIPVSYELCRQPPATTYDNAVLALLNELEAS